MTTIFRTSFAGPAAARLALMLAACAGLALLTPASSAARELGVPAGTDLVEYPSSDSTRDHEWKTDVNGDLSDTCDDDDGDDESSSGSGLVTFGREHLSPHFSYSAHFVGVIEDRRRSREVDVHLLRGPPASAKKPTDIADADPAGTHYSRSRRGRDRRAPHVHLLPDPLRSACAASDYLLRAPP